MIEAQPGQGEKNVFSKPWPGRVAGVDYRIVLLALKIARMSISTLSIPRTIPPVHLYKRANPGPAQSDFPADVHAR